MDDPYQLDQEFNNLPRASDPSGGNSSTSEPEPGEPLSAEAERILEDVPSSVGASDAPRGYDGGMPEPGRPTVSVGPLPSHVFNVEIVRSMFEKTYKGLAAYFDSGHWELSPLESELLAQPGKLLLDSCWVHIQRMLPLWFQGWADSTPGLIEFLIAMGIINYSRVVEQVAISVERRTHAAPAKPRTEPSQPKPQQPRGAGPIIMDGSFGEGAQ